MSGLERAIGSTVHCATKLDSKIPLIGVSGQSEECRRVVPMGITKICAAYSVAPVVVLQSGT